jgi:hypothetical protein
MNATLPVNRISAHYDSPQQAKAKPVLPKTARERAQLWSDIVFEAALTLRDQLQSPIAAVAASAAHALIDLERTRMRHDQAVSGSATGSEHLAQQIKREDREERKELRDENWSDAEEEKISELEAQVDAFAYREHVEEVIEDYAKRGRKVSKGDAEELVTACLEDWGIKTATAIPRGGFVAEKRRRGDTTEPEDFE